MSRRRKNPSLQRGLFKSSLYANNMQFVQYATQLFEMCMARGQWSGLPPTVNQRYMEETLCTNGACVFFKDPVLGYLALPVMWSAPLNVYGDPIKRIAYSKDNNYRMPLDESNSVIIYNNYTRTSNIPDIVRYSERLYDYDCTIDVNVRAQKTPILIVCDENERLSMANMYAKIDGNQPAIFCKKSINRDNIQSLRTDAPFVADRIQSLRNNIWNEALTTLGIPNTDTSKRERLITSEVERSQGGVIAVRNSAEKMRQDGCRQIKDKFGLDIWYEFDLIDGDPKTKSGDITETEEVLVDE